MSLCNAGKRAAGRRLLAAGALGLAWTAGLGWSPVARAQPAELAGVVYPSAIKVEGQALPLNGTGITYRAVAKLYTIGLYTPQKSSKAEVVLAQNGPKQLRFVMLQGMRVDEVGKTVTKGIELNSSREEFFNLIPAIRTMGEVFSRIKRLNTGDTFTIEYVPKRGTMFFVNGQPAGLPITDERFYPAVLRVWLGTRPASQDLKDALLSYKPPAVLDALE
jgi:hypothetical protein